MATWQPARKSKNSRHSHKRKKQPKKSKDGCHYIKLTSLRLRLDSAIQRIRGWLIDASARADSWKHRTRTDLDRFPKRRVRKVLMTIWCVLFIGACLLGIAAFFAAGKDST